MKEGKERKKEVKKEKERKRKGKKKEEKRKRDKTETQQKGLKQYIRKIFLTVETAKYYTRLLTE